MTAILAVAAILTGCASDLGGDAYSRREARQVMQVRFATVESVRPVLLEGTKTPVGAVAGAAVGGIAGSALGRGRGSAIGSVVGAVAGGLGGAAVEEAVTRERGMEVTVRLDHGEYLAVVQADRGEDFQPGERVRLVGSGGAARVTR
ncbi:MAG: glycine zipper 2TM domain-containing protein [Azoarcus sp.]|nr:glycine zipper 2TM domain-containing protein [Azoarcus sp.]